MRPEVIEVLDYAARLRQRPNYWETHEPASGKEYSSLLSDEDTINLNRVYRAYACVTHSLRHALPYLDIYAGTTTNICIRWDTDPHNEIVVELSLYGNLAAPFIYGQPSSKVLTVLAQCIMSCGLIQLSKEEIVELETSGTFLTLF